MDGASVPESTAGGDAARSVPPPDVRPALARKPGWRRLGPLVLAAAAVAAALWLLPIGPALKSALVSVLEWTRGTGPGGAVALVGIYVAACVLFLPGSILTLGAGFAFGLFKGTLAVVAGSLLGVTAAFFLGRTLARGWVERKIAGSPRFRAIDAAVAREGFKIVLLTRLSPVFPFNLLNYAFGVTRVSFRDYFFASWIGMFPGTVLYVYLGSLTKDLAELAEGKTPGGTARWVFLVVGLAATIAVTYILTRIARRALTEAVATDAAIAPVPSSTPPAAIRPEEKRHD